MNDILNSTEYLKLREAEARRDTAHAARARAEKAVLDTALLPFYSHARYELTAGGVVANYRNADVDVAIVEEACNAARAALFAAFPPPADVTSAIEVATAAKAAKDAAVKAFEDSLTDEQRALRDAVTAAETRLDDTVARAKSLILEFGASPSKAFVVRRTDKHEVAGDVRPLLRDVSLGDLPTDLVSLNVKAIVQRAADGLDNRGLTVTTTQTANVAAYLNKL